MATHMNRKEFGFTVGFAIGLAVLAGIRSVAAQDDPGKPKQSEEKNADKTIDVRVKVSTKGGEPIPDGSYVEISGQEKACGSLQETDSTSRLDTKTGEATFTKLPVCKVTIKAICVGFKVRPKETDLRQYKDAISITIEH